MNGKNYMKMEAGELDSGDNRSERSSRRFGAVMMAVVVSSGLLAASMVSGRNSVVSLVSEQEHNAWTMLKSSSKSKENVVYKRDKYYEDESALCADPNGWVVKSGAFKFNSTYDTEHCLLQAYDEDYINILAMTSENFTAGDDLGIYAEQLRELTSYRNTMILFRMQEWPTEDIKLTKSMYGYACNANTDNSVDDDADRATTLQFYLLTGEDTYDVLNTSASFYYSTNKWYTAKASAHYNQMGCEFTDSETGEVLASITVNDDTYDSGSVGIGLYRADYGHVYWKKFIVETIDSETAYPSSEPTTYTPTISPTMGPTTSSPSVSPTTAEPTPVPTSSPTTAKPTPKPSTAPTHNPTTPKPSSVPTTTPTRSPTTAKPSAPPSLSPTTASPSAVPSAVPTFIPTQSPTTPKPSSVPTAKPTLSPTTAKPSAPPTLSPTTASPSAVPSAVPTFIPTLSPTTPKPSSVPTMSPTTAKPSTEPTKKPTPSPTSAPSSVPTSVPTEDDITEVELSFCSSAHGWTVGSGSFSWDSSFLSESCLLKATDADNINMYGSNTEYSYDDELSMNAVVAHEESTLRNTLLYLRIQSWPTTDIDYTYELSGYACDLWSDNTWDSTDDTRPTQLRIMRMDDGTNFKSIEQLAISDSFTFDADQWYTQSANVYKDTIECTYSDSNGNVLASVSVTDSTYASGLYGIGFYRADDGYAYWKSLDLEIVSHS